MARRGGLGKGLGALIPTGPTEAPTESGGGLEQVPVSAIVPNQYQPRAHFDEEELTSLAESIRAVGVLQPVLVRPKGDGTFELIAGERRWRASRRVGLQTIPALIRETDDTAALEQALVENYAAALDEILRVKPSSSKGRYIKKAVISTTMGPGIQVDPNKTRNLLAEDDD